MNGFTGQLEGALLSVGKYQVSPGIERAPMPSAFDSCICMLSHPLELEATNCYTTASDPVTILRFSAWFISY